MIKYILIMIICSGIPGNECKPIPHLFLNLMNIINVLFMGMIILVQC